MREGATYVGAVVVAVLIAIAAHAQRGPGGDAPALAVTFENVTKAARLEFAHTNGASPEKYLVETMGSGALFFDYDNDGWIDLFVVDGGSLADAAVAARARHHLFRNRRNGTFEDVSSVSGIGHREYGMGACAGDIDNDGHTDLYVTNDGPNTLYQNRGGGRFTDITRTAGVGLEQWSTSCAFLDVERDGDLDLFVANYLDAPKSHNPFCGDPRRRIRVYCHPLNFKGLPNVLYRNDGSGKFTNVSVEAGIARFAGNGLGVAVGDYDDDGWPDVFVANDAVPNFLFHNEGNGRFAEVGLPAGVAVARDGKARAGMGTEFADYTNDGRLDLVVTNHEFETHSLFRNDGNCIFTYATVESGLGPPTLPFVGFGVAFLDFDNDGRLDLSIMNGHVIDNTAMFRAGSTHAQPKLLLRNTNGRRFADVGRQSGSGFATSGVGRSLIVGDVDNDGDVDVAVTNNGGGLELLRNDGGHRGHALTLRLVGVASNRGAIGTRATLTAGGRAQTQEVKSGSSYLGQHDTRLHFGLGQTSRVERLDIRWPNGGRERIDNPAIDRIITIEEGKGITSSTPFTR